MPCRTMCTVCGFAALSHSYFIRLYSRIHTDEDRMRQGSQVAGRRASAGGLAVWVGFSFFLWIRHDTPY
ncbi:hypothetical protein D0T90_05130 [Neisseria animalis]|uniref:Uncharacterized protein n=1 Tax=Neisseria animalis TaxID=492 RepID=A0A5P3MQU1_NEIAN|nr:hypothetical protein D0T90_05130 [Neisseria animalis]ROW31646.1 hypothetical protein CGZ60_09085 [Neisseria animalis]